MSNRYDSIEIVKNSLGKRYYINNIYPDIPVTDNDIYIITTITDRLDLLANTFYNDSTLYWILASANRLPGDSLVPPVGQQLRVPAPSNIDTIINQYISINEIR